MGFDIKMHDGQIETIFDLIKEMMKKNEEINPHRNPIGFKST